jgi:uncharacterized membrane protein
MSEILSIIDDNSKVYPLTSLPKNRIESIDLLKGLVMVLMALDHTRDYFHQTFNLMALTDPAHTNAPVFITRWISHFCAPAFSFLAGVSAFMVGKRKTKNELSGFLFKRGLWLIFIELTIVTFAWYLDIRFRNMDLAVIWSLGMSMIFLAAFIHLPKNIILLVALLLIFGHNLLDNIHFDRSIWWSMLHETAFFKVSNTFNFNIIYPIIPWIGVMALGYYVGNFYDKSIEPGTRKKLFNTIGVAAIVLFVAIRWTNLYGDPVPWKRLETFGLTIFSFLNLHKYPPSLLYLLVTLGGTFFFLANSEKWRGRIVNFFTVFGRVPFFFYILHLYLIRLLAMVIAELTGHGWELMVQTTFEIDLKDFGFNLGIVYLIWMGIILTLYPICKKFDNYKQSHKDKWWLSYL